MSFVQAVVGAENIVFGVMVGVSRVRLDVFCQYDASVSSLCLVFYVEMFRQLCFVFVQMVFC